MEKYKGYPFLITIIVITFAHFAFSANDPLKACQEHIRFGVPKPQKKLLCHRAYLVSYNKETKDPDWVLYHLTADHLQHPRVKRINHFQADPDLAPGERAELSDYRGSGYSRGHLDPAADNRWSFEAMTASFYLSNMVPQNQSNNAGIWARLERFEREWALRCGELYVVAGPLFRNKNKMVGTHHVYVPTDLFKVIYDPVHQKSVAFVIPNRGLKGHSIDEYRFSVLDVEKLTGVIFFPLID